MGKKAESMFRDITESENMVKDFKEHFSFDCNFFVLEQGSWPIRSRVKSVIIPQQIDSAQKAF